MHRSVQSCLEGLGYQLWGIRQQRRGKTHYLQVFIDSENGISVADCALASRELGISLDAEYPDTGDYELEVSSPGVDRLLFTEQQYRSFIGHMVTLRLFQAISGSRKLVGKLIDCADNCVTVKNDHLNEKIAISEIKEARLASYYSNVNL